MPKKYRKFKRARVDALQHWLRGSNRKRDETHSDDCIDNSYECCWQSDAGGVDTEGQHVSLFCAVGDWACHITDLLSDQSQDELFFSNEESERRISRHYARLMFVVAELLSDFEVALKEIDFGRGQNDRRIALGVDVAKFNVFVNKIIKHKTGNIHKCDHHLRINFKDSAKYVDDLDICVGIDNCNIDFSGREFSYISYPSLVDIIDVALIAYGNFNSILGQGDNFGKICEKFREGNLTPIVSLEAPAR